MADPTPADPSRMQTVPPVPFPDRDRPGRHLPLLLTSFVGRQREVAAVVELVRRPGVRMVTLTGPGGVGKTRLAIRVAEAVADAFPDSVWFVALAPVRDPALVATTIAQALDVRETGARPVEESLREFLRARRALLVLDNFEHLLDAGPLVADLLSACPDLAVLVTSRAVLRISGEHAVAVPPLALPTSDATPGTGSQVESEAVQLFVERAEAARSDFAVTASNAPTIAAICERLDGLPLAIELAAARVASLPPATLLTLVERRLALLTGGPRDQPPRLRTMRDAIAWSYDLLPPVEQALFRRLAVFVGGFALEAAEAVGAAEGKPALGVLEGVASLVDKSLLRPEADPSAEPRYLILETVREFGLEQLDASGDTEDARRAHGSYFLALAEQAAPELNGPRQVEWFARLETEHPNLRAALEWFGQRGDAEAGLRLAAALWHFWFIRGHHREGRAWLARVLAGPRRWSPALREALHGASMLASNQGDDSQATAYAEDLLAISREQDDQEGVVRALYLLSFAATYRGDQARALALAEEALSLSRRLGDPHWVALVVNRLGIECHVQGDYARAVALYDEALNLWRARGDSWRLACVTTNLGVTAQARGQTSQAATRYRESLALLQALGQTWMNEEVLAVVADLAAASGDRERAARLIGATDGLLQLIGFDLAPFVHAFYQRAADRVRRELGEEAFAAGREEGRRLTPAQALGEAYEVVSALADAPAPSQPSASAGGLSPRELEVLRLLVAGRTDREIGEALFVSRRTVTSHVTGILAKLGVDNRAAAAAHAVRHGLV